MNAERLLAQFERVADAPDAIPRLRRLILDLAVRGKLVEQDPNDEPAEELLKRIAAEKTRLLKEGKVKKRKELTNLQESDLPFKIPNYWQWIRLGELGFTQTGTTPTKNNKSLFGNYIPFIKPADIFSTYVDYSKEGLSKAGAKASGRLAGIGSILMVCIGTIGKCQIIDRNCSFNQQINALSPLDKLESRYLLIACKSDFFQKAAWSASARSTIAILNKGNWEKLPIPLPPLAEQQRIVAKVDELMALCDELEASQAEREATRERLAAASLARLNEPDPESFRDDARFALDALPALTKRPDQIQQLRQIILNLAVRGKLVEQDPTDEPAEELLKRAKATKLKIMMERRIRRDKKPELSASLGEQSSPRHWSWAYLHDFAVVLGGKRLPSGATFSTENTGYIYIRVTDMKSGSISPEDLKYISEDVREKIAKYTIDRDDIYITIAGTIGEVGEVPDFCHGQNLTENAAKIVFREINRKFLLLVLRSEDVQVQFQEKMKQMAQPKLALKRISGARVPLPPLAEQHRIVAKVDELMGLCDELEASLADGEETRSRLLDALLAEAIDA